MGNLSKDLGVGAGCVVKPRSVDEMDGGARVVFEGHFFDVRRALKKSTPTKRNDSKGRGWADHIQDMRECPILTGLPEQREMKELLPAPVTPITTM